MAWEDVKDAFRPQTVHKGVMKVDEDVCTSCGLCVQNCVFRCFETDDSGIPHLRDGYMCFSCFNCMVACPVDAISIVETYHVHEGAFASVPYPLPVRMPIEPRTADGKPDEWNSIERLVLSRRSIRNYKNKPVPAPLIDRVIEAGRFAPSGANNQPWQFIVVTKKALINEMNDLMRRQLRQRYEDYIDDDRVRTLAAQWEANPIVPATTLYDPRPVIGAGHSIGGGLVPALLDAPVVIIICVDRRAAGGIMNACIAAQNMTLVAMSLGLGSCYVGFTVRCNSSPDLLEKLHIRPPFEIAMSLTLGYPKFRQYGVVPREFRPIIWHLEGVDEPEIRE